MGFLGVEHKMTRLTQFLSRKNIFMIVMFAAAFGVPLVFPGGSEVNYGMHTLSICCLFAIASLGWNIAYGFSGLMLFGPTAFFGIGAYATVIFLTTFQLTPWIGIWLGGLLAAIFGALLSWLTVRTRGFYFALCTFVVPQILLLAVIHPGWSHVTGGSYGLSVPFIGESLYYMQFYSRTPYYYIALIFLVISCVFLRKITESKIGYYMRAMGNDENAAESIGINVFRIRILGMGLSAFFTGLAGGLYANSVYFIDPFMAFGFFLNTQFILFALLGGVGTIVGPIIGSSILVLFSELVKFTLEQQFSAGIHLVVYGLSLMIIILYRPQGIYPWVKKNLKRVGLM